MAGRSEFIFTELAIGNQNAESAIDPSYGVVKRGTNPNDVAECSAVTDFPIGRANAKTSAGEAVEGGVQPLIPGQTMKLISDGTFTNAGEFVMCSTTAGRVGKSTPTSGDVVFGLTAEADPGAGYAILVDVFSPYKHVDT
ncbi:MAG: hypothetical protein KKD44_29060 [Proteobacteria bacterium]|nr:hypothetical protein [Pseudomonadota bacterium]